MVEGARLESVYRLIAYRGFESLSHRHNIAAIGIDIMAVSDSAETSGFEKNDRIIF